MTDGPLSAGDFERLVIERTTERTVLKLYVTGMTPRSTEAVKTIRAICHEQIIAAPTLVRMAPEPRRRLIGNLSDRVRVLRGLNLEEPAISPAGDA